jgi:hypothetical protein
VFAASDIKASEFSMSGEGNDFHIRVKSTPTHQRRIPAKRLTAPITSQNALKAYVFAV